MTRVLFVCLGNICRSPSAEAVLRAKAPDLTVDSAGTSDWHVGSPPYGQAIEVGSARGYDLSPLRARQVRESDFSDFDWILAMDDQNLSDLRALAPSDASAKLSLFLEFARGTEARAVPDPYYTRDFEGALDLIEQAADGFLAELLKASAP